MKRTHLQPTHKDVFFVMDNVRHGSPRVIYLIFFGITIPCGIGDLIMAAVLIANAVDKWGIGQDAIIALIVLIGICALFIAFAVWLLVKNVKLYKQIDEWLNDAIEVRASVRAKGNRNVESIYLANNVFEITLHLPDGDTIRTSSVDKTVSDNNGWLYRYDGKDTSVFYSAFNDKIMFANSKYIKNKNETLNNLNS
ncbi:MAG: hypothetical protein J1G38_02970 [Clostridiales bacterium]|nr:hypothetical protein [Clostridiales bacterium]